MLSTSLPSLKRPIPIIEEADDADDEYESEDDENNPNDSTTAEKIMNDRRFEKYFRIKK